MRINSLPFIVASIVVCCSRAATAQSSSGYLPARSISELGVLGNPNLAIEMEIDGNWSRIDAAPVVWVGQRIHLRAKMNDQSTINTTSKSWQVLGGKPFSYYDRENNSARKYSLVYPNSTEIIFRWQNRRICAVNFSAKANGKNVYKGIKFEVKKPIMTSYVHMGDTFYYEAGSVDYGSAFTEFTANPDYLTKGILLGSSKNQDWPTGKGLLCWVQVVYQAQRSPHDKNANQWYNYLPNAGTGTQYPWLDRNDSTWPFTIHALSGYDIATWDAPGQSTDLPAGTDVDEMQLHDKFAMYLFFKYDEDEADWVPLFRVPWEYNVHAYRDISGAWRFSSQSHTENPAPIEPDPGFPEWDGIVTPGTYIKASGP